jgi:hypothetical protein
MESHDGIIFTGETEELGENLSHSHFHFVHHKSHIQ